MKKLTTQQENLQLIGIMGADECNTILKQHIKNSTAEKVHNDNCKMIKVKKTSVDYLKAVK